MNKYIKTGRVTSRLFDAFACFAKDERPMIGRKAGVRIGRSQTILADPRRRGGYSTRDQKK